MVYAYAEANVDRLSEAEVEYGRLVNNVYADTADLTKTVELAQSKVHVEKRLKCCSCHSHGVERLAISNPLDCRVLVHRAGCA